MPIGKGRIALAVCLWSAPALGSASPQDFSAAAQEATSLLQAYLRIDTTNPPGREKLAADFFDAIFRAEGIESAVFDLGGGRANVLARLPGNGRRRPIILLNHLDVVPAEASRWTVPPFSGQIRDGYVWGRGATDMKGTAVSQLMTLLLLKRTGATLDRDVIFLGTADEEAGDQSGLRAMIATHRERLRNAEFVLTEGANIALRSGRSESWNVDVTEKSALWLRLSASGKAGHASIPDSAGAVARLIRAANRILDYEPPVRLIPAVEAYFRQLSKTAAAPLAQALADPAVALADPEKRRLLLSDPFRNACLRSTISITGLSGSDKINVIPGRATATLDCRLLPGDDPVRFRSRLAEVVDDPSVSIEVLEETAATASPIDTELFRAIERARDRFDAGVPVLTPPLTSTTDATYLREIGMVVYGFEPFRLAAEDDHSHGDDERLSLSNVRFGLEVLFAVVVDVAGAR